jgi:hypothetical protein
MTEEQAKKISELYKLKSDLLKDLSILTDNENILGLCYSNYSYFGYGAPLLKCSELLSNEIKEIVLTKLQLEIDKIDLELTNIKCV